MTAPAAAPVPFPDYARAPFVADGVTFEVLRREVQGAPTVILLHELPGLSAHTVALADHLVGEGFTVAMPSLLPPIVLDPGMGTALRNTWRICVSDQFVALARRADRPLTRWLRALATREALASGRQVGIVGMCLTGGFALAAAVDTAIGAAVASQPSVPFCYGDGTIDLAMSADTLDELAARAEAGFCVRALRFSRDMVSRRQRLRFIGEALPNSVVVEVPSRRLFDHSVLTSAVGADEDSPLGVALRETVEYLHARLDAPGATT